MISNYTKTLKEFITQGGNVHKDKFDLLPTFIVGTQTYNLYDLFITRYGLREIGAETEELFSHYLSIKLDEINIKYSMKIEIFITNFNKLFDRKVKLERTIERTNNGNNKQTFYIQPITDVNGIVDSYNTENGSNTENLTETEERAFSYFQSNPQIMNEILNMQNIYYTALDEFNILFMGVY